MDLFRDDDFKKDVPFVPFFDVAFEKSKRTKSQVFIREEIRHPSNPNSFTQEKKEIIKTAAKSADGLENNTVKSHIEGTVISK